ncbi:DUF2835 domain-containing protein [Marinobacter sp.]|uniref:DUF2835 domain-containing protein n=1 Tax=Marinobacter sp. TaxID=50741 RepID=UPI00384AEBF6
MQHLDLDIAISSDEWIKVYQGVASDVHAVSRDGRKVRFPARILSKFYLREGVRGSFRIFFDNNGKFVRIERLN